MSDVIDMRKEVLPSTNSSLRQLVDELESIVLLQKRAMNILAWRAPSTKSEIAIISNTMSVLHEHLCALNALLARAK